MTSLVRTAPQEYERFGAELEEIGILPIEYVFCKSTLIVREGRATVTFNRDDQSCLLRSENKRERCFGRYLFDRSMTDGSMLRVNKRYVRCRSLL